MWRNLWAKRAPRPIPSCVCCLLAALCGALLLGAGPAPAQDDGETAKNGGFEEGAFLWSLPKVFTVVDDVAHSGKHSLRVQNTDPDPAIYNYAFQPLPLMPGMCYRFSAWIKTQGAAAAVCIDWRGPKGHLGGCWPPGGAGNHDWFRVEGTTTAIPREAIGVALLCRLEKGSTGTAWFDDVSVQIIRPEGPQPDIGAPKQLVSLDFQARGLSEAILWVLRETALPVRIPAALLADDALARKPFGCKTTNTPLDQVLDQLAAEYHIRWQMVDGFVAFEPAPEGGGAALPAAGPAGGAADAAEAAARKLGAPADGPVQRTASGLRFIDVTTGTGKPPAPNQTVVIHYTVWLENGKKVDSSIDRGQPTPFALNGQMINGWREGVSTMKPGGIRKLIVPPSLGYGAAGAPPLIPPNATLIFEVGVLRVQE